MPLAGALAGLALRTLAFSGKPRSPFSAMLVSFLYGSPVLVGMVTVYLAERTARRSWTYYCAVGMFANVLCVLGSLPVLPCSGTGEFRDGEHLRHVTMGKGVRFDQVAVQWQENARVTWRHRFDAESFPPGALADFLAGDFAEEILRFYARRAKRGEHLPAN